MDARQKWKWIKRIRSDYRRRPASIHNAQGKPVSQTKQAQTFAQHLADKQWAQPASLQPGGDGHRPFHSGGVRRGASQGLAQQGGGSGRHPDRGVAVAHRGQQKEVAGYTQPGAHSRAHPAGMATALLVVEIYKGKGSTADPNNYRPISLLSTAYKLMARILQQRLEKTIDHRLRDTQFGFRAGHPCLTPDAASKISLVWPAALTWNS